MSSAAWAAPYTDTAKSLHWIMALLTLDVMVMGFYMHDLPLSPKKLRFYSWHKWGGVGVMLLLLIRVRWPLTHRQPALPWMKSRLRQTVAVRCVTSAAQNWISIALIALARAFFIIVNLGLKFLFHSQKYPVSKHSDSGRR